MTGFHSYNFKEINAEELHHLVADKQAALIDVRSEGEVAQGVIQGARHIPLHLLPLKAQELKSDIPVIYYCRTGARSAQACMFMAAQGHHNSYNLQGGIMGWVQSGRTLSTATQ